MEKTILMTPEKVLIANIEHWALERNFFGEGGATVQDQIIKLTEEAGEHAKNYLRGKDVSDDIGDMLVVLVILSKLTGYSLSSLVSISVEKNSFDEILYAYQISDDYDKISLKSWVIRFQANLGMLSEHFACGKSLKAPIRNILYALIVLADKNGLTLQECGISAYKEIKPRKGQFREGVFIKESDLNQI